MIIKTYSSPTDILKKVEKLLMEKEAENNLPLGLLNRLQQEEEEKTVYTEQNKPFLALGENDDGKPVFVMVQIPPYNLVVCGNISAVDSIAEWLGKNIVQIPGVVGSKPLVDKFAEAWKRETNCRLQIIMQQRIYKLESVNKFHRRKGRLCCATEEDIALVTYWTQRFYEEILEEPKESTEDFIKKEIEYNRIFLWQDENGVPVSMAKRSRESKNGAALSGVYTPDKYKKQGYATTCVAALSEWLLKKGFKFCSLYTDLANPTSNRIYMKIGYEPVADSAGYRFIYWEHSPR